MATLTSNHPPNHDKNKRYVGLFDETLEINWHYSLPDGPCHGTIRLRSDGVVMLLHVLVNAFVAYSTHAFKLADNILRSLEALHVIKSFVILLGKVRAELEVCAEQLLLERIAVIYLFLCHNYSS